MCLGDYSNTKVEAVINEWVHSAFDRKVMHLRLIDGQTHESIAEIMGVEPITIKRHVKKCMPIILDHMNQI